MKIPISAHWASLLNANLAQQQALNSEIERLRNELGAITRNLCLDGGAQPDELDAARCRILNEAGQTFILLESEPRLVN